MLYFSLRGLAGLRHHGRVPIPSEPPVDAIPLFEEERRRLLLLLGDLTDRDWEQPTRCPGWNVLDVAYHLVGGDLGVISRRRDQFFGTEPPPGTTEASFITWLDDLQMEWVRAARRISPRLIVELLAWTGPALVETLRDDEPQARSAHVSWAGPAPVPVWLDHLRELSERWIHRQQMLEGLDRPGDLDPLLVGPILLGLRWAYPYRLGGAQAADGDTVTVAVSGPVAETWWLVARDGGWDFAPQPGTREVAAISLTTDQAWRLLSNNLDPEERAAIDHTSHGDDQLVGILMNTRAIIGDPK